MKKNVILSTVAATVVTGVLMMSGCGGSNNSSISDITNNDKNGGTIVGKTKVTNQGASEKKYYSEDNKTVLGSMKYTSSTTTAGKNPCTTADPCTVVFKRDCYKKTSGINTVTGYDNKLVRDAAFAEINKAFEVGGIPFTAPAGKTIRFSGALEISEKDGRIDKCTGMKIEFKAPPCATDSNGDWHYINNQAENGEIVDTAELLVLVTPLVSGVADEANSYWLKVPITDPKSFDLRKAVLNLTGETALPARLFVYAIQNSDTTGTTGTTGSN